MVKEHKEDLHGDISDRCDLGNQTTNREASIKSHVKHIHKSEKCKCSNCKNTSVTSDSITEHIENGHTNKKEDVLAKYDIEFSDILSTLEKYLDTDTISPAEAG